MSEEDFLSRWSRRKAEAAQPARHTEPQAEAVAPAPVPPEAEVPAAPANGEAEFDPSTLPPIDSITAASDITAFLRKGVPLDLTRAALRRAWVSDPFIRDFVGLAENAWDFNDPNAMPGFGPLDETPEQIREWVARIVGGVRQTAEEVVVDDVGGKRSESTAQEMNFTAESQPSTRPSQPAEIPETAHAGLDDDSSRRTPIEDGDAAPQNDDREASVMRRTHGGALPR